jgi:hypothetical protein
MTSSLVGKSEQCGVGGIVPRDGKDPTAKHRSAAITQWPRLATLCCSVTTTETAITLSGSLAASRNCVAGRKPAMPMIVMFWLKNPT